MKGRLNWSVLISPTRDGVGQSSLRVIACLHRVIETALRVRVKDPETTQRFEALRGERLDDRNDSAARTGCSCLLANW